MSGTEVITRRPRAGRERDDDDEAVPGVTIEQPDQISPEDALAESRRQLQASQQQTAEARRQAREAQQTAQRAAQQSQEATAARISDREVAFNSVLESAKAEITTAKAAYRLAREAGDVDGEIAAQEMLAGATMRAQNANAEIERIKAAPKPEVQQRHQPTQQQGGMTPEAQAWADAHPAFASDRRYKALAVAAHEEAIEQGLQADTPAYFDHINDALTQEYGEGHGQVGGRQVQQQPRQRQQSDGLPPSRHAGGAQGGYKTLSTPLGNLSYRQSRDGRIESVKFADTATHENFKEGAETSFRKLFEADPDKALAEFATETIAEHLEGSETIRNGDGRILR